MEELLKGLEGKTFTKKKLFDFLADINLDSISVSNKEEKEEKVEKIDIKCQACMKTLASDASLKRHHERNPACVKWIYHPQKTDIQLKKGLHLIIDELLKNSISYEKLECKHCNSSFTNNGNLHKHLNTSTVCNRLAYQEFKDSFNNL